MDVNDVRLGSKNKNLVVLSILDIFPNKNAFPIK